MPNIMDQFNTFVGRKAKERETPAAGTQPNAQDPAAGQQKVQQGSSTVLESGAAGQDPNNPGGKSNTPTNNLDNFSEMWQTSPANGEAGKPKRYVDYDAKAFREKAKSLDFAKTLDPALTAKALGGDVNSFHQIINQAVQGAFSMAVEGSMSLAEKGFGSAESRFFERLPGELKKHSAFDSSVTKNPKMNHPAVKPLVSVIHGQLQGKFPDASTADIQKMTEEYFTEFFAAVNTSDEDPAGKKPPQDGQLQKSGETDWMKTMGFSDDQ